MDTRKKIEKLSDADFQLYLGIDRPTFYTALEILETENKIQRKKGGTPLKTSIFERLVITLNYYREYRSLRHIAIDYGISKSNVDQIIHWTENMLIKSGKFSLPSKRELYQSDTEENVLVDATEVEIERPKKNKNNFTQAKRKSIR